MKRRRALACALTLGWVCGGAGGWIHGAPPAAKPSDARAIVLAVIEKARGISSYGEMTMTIHRPDWERSLSMRAWTEGLEHSLVRVTAPKKDVGNGTLVIGNNMWSFAPRVNRVIKIPSSMMAQSWMGSDFSNRDVSRSDEIVDRYDHRLLSTEKREGRTVWVVESVPHEDAAVVWGKEILTIREDEVLLRQDYYDQEGQRVKSLVSVEIGEMGGRTIAVRQHMARVDREEEWTEFVVQRIQFDLDLDETTFTLSNLRNPRD